MDFDKAKIIFYQGKNKELKKNGVEIIVLFNPENYSINNTVECQPDKESDVLQIKKVPATLTVTLFFDSTEEGGSVMDDTDRIIQLMQVDSTGTPPLCTFAWGKLVFDGVITSVDQKFLMFSENGNPVRAQLTVNFTAAETVKDSSPEIKGKAEIGTSDLSIKGLEEQYDTFYEPVFNIKVGETVLLKEGMSIESVTVETDTGKADSFSFVVTNAFDDEKKEIKWADKLAPGEPVTIAAGYGEKVQTIFNGFVTAVEFQFSNEKKLEVIVSGMDASFKMMKGIKSFSWTKKKHSDVASEIAGKYGLKNEIDPTEVQYEIVEQSKVTDYQFLSWMANQNNYEFFVAGGTMYFRKPYKKKSPVISLELNSWLYNLKIEHDIGDQTGAIEVRGWDPVKKQEIKSDSGAIDMLNSGGKTGESVIKKLCGSDVKEYVYANAESAEAAGKMATAIANQRSLKLVSGKGESVGIPELRAGSYMKLSGAGKKLNKLYYIVSATHIINDKGYKTLFNLEGNTI